MIYTYRRLGELLVARGAITNLQLSVALADQLVSSRRLGDILVERDFTTENEIAACLAEQYNYPLIDFEAVACEPEALRRLSAEDALQLRALPIAVTTAGLVCAIADPIDVVATDRLAALVRMRILLHIAPESALMRKLRTAYGLDEHFSPVAFPEGHKAPKRFGALVSRTRCGHGLLFDAIDMQLDRKVSLTCWKAGDESLAETIEIVRAAAKGPVSGLCAVYDVIAHSGFRWVVMSRLYGDSLDRILKQRGARPVPTAADLVGTIGTTVDAIQRLGGSGGWVCPSNIFLGHRGPILAPITPPPSHYCLSHLEDEEIPGTGTVYALGQLLKECVYGTDDKSQAYVPGPMLDILRGCLAIDPKERYASVVEVVSALKSFNWQALANPIGHSTAEERQHLLQTLNQPSEPTQEGTVSLWKRLFSKRAA